MAMQRGLRLAAGAAVACGLLALTVATAQRAKPCDVVEPDSLEISWTAPCDEGRWLLDPQSGCRIWDWRPAPEDTATWTGRCRAGMKEGDGVVQWFEHGRPIDRFEGRFVGGRRQGHGRYVWNETDWYDGTYANDVPHGPGTAHIASVALAGHWTRGCLKLGPKVVAIGVPRKSCEEHEQRIVECTVAIAPGP